MSFLQRWIYRIDPKRVNEYGQVMGADDKAPVVATSGTEVSDKTAAQLIERKKETKKTK
jgi:hypothetical protein